MKTELNTLLNRVDTRLAACAAAAGASLAVVPASHADIVYSGPVSIGIPDNIDGIYMNIVTGVFGTSPPSGYDINPYSALAGQLNLWGPTTNTWFSTGDVNGPYNLAFGTSISGAAAAFFRPGGSIAITLNLNSSNNYLGFRFVNEALGNQVQFGWIQLQVGATAGDRSIIGYAYENTGVAIGAGVIPEPTTLALLGVMAAGALGVRAWRGRKAA